MFGIIGSLFSGGKLYLAIGFAVVLSLLVGGAYWYYTDTQSKLQTYAENAAKLELAVSTQTDTIDYLRSSMEDMQKEIQRQVLLRQDLEAEISDVKDEVSKVGETLQKHDLQFLALKKPKLIENRINAATKKMFETIESETQ